MTERKAIVNLRSRERTSGGPSAMRITDPDNYVTNNHPAKPLTLGAACYSCFGSDCSGAQVRLAVGCRAPARCHASWTLLRTGGSASLQVRIAYTA